MSERHVITTAEQAVIDAAKAWAYNLASSNPKYMVDLSQAVAALEEYEAATAVGEKQ